MVSQGMLDYVQRVEGGFIFHIVLTFLVFKLSPPILYVHVYTSFMGPHIRDKVDTLI